MARIDKPAAVLVTVVACVTLLWIGAVQAKPTPTQKCQEAKLGAQGKLQLCLKKNSAKVLGGKPDNSAKCQTKFQTALSKADQIGIAAGTAACRYVNNHDGTVSDLNTGLVWEQKGHLDSTVNASDPHDVDNTYTWSTGTNNPDGTAFTIFLYGLNGGTSPDGTATSGCFAGHCDWRLPTIEELAGIVDATQGNCGGGSGPCIDPIFGPTQASYYWSATTFAGSPVYAWYVNFFHGLVVTDLKTLIYYVRAVRDGL